MQNNSRRFTRKVSPRSLATAGLLVGLIGCSSGRWEKQPGPYTSGDQPMGGYTTSPKTGMMTTQPSAVAPTTAPAAPSPESPAVVRPPTGDPVPKTPTEETPKPETPAPTEPKAPEVKAPDAKPAEVKPAAEAAPAEAQVVVGLLEGNISAIGGETTGWRITDDKGTATEVDVSAVREQAKKLDGKRARVVGTIITKQYVERGPTKVLSAQRIEAAPAAAPAEDNK